MRRRLCVAAVLCVTAAILAPGSIAGGQEPPAPVQEVTTVVTKKKCLASQFKHRRYATRVYRRASISKRAERRLARLRRCAASQQAKRNMIRLERRERSARRARMAMYCGTPLCNRRLIYWMAAAKYGPAGGRCLVALAGRESGWNHRIANGSSGAYGIPQSLPGAKMASHGRDWATNPATQVRWMLSYVAGRYGGPCQADRFQRVNGWY